MDQKQQFKTLANTIIHSPSLSFTEKQKIFTLLSNPNVNLKDLAAKVDELVKKNNIVAIRELINTHE